MSDTARSRRWLRGPLKGQGRGSLVLRLILLFLAVWLAGFAVFAAKLLSPPQWQGDKVMDVAIVLTGGAGRLEAAADILRQRKVGKVLISGVHGDVSAKRLQRLLNLPGDLVTCCVLLDKRARNTRHNAQQAVQWASDVGARSLLLITSDYHLPRAYYLLTHQIKVQNAPMMTVETIGVSTGRAPFMIFKEYHKYLLSLMLNVQLGYRNDP